MSSVVGLEVLVQWPRRHPSNRAGSTPLRSQCLPNQPASISSRGRVVLVGQLNTRYFVPFMYSCRLRNHLHTELQL